MDESYECLSRPNAAGNAAPERLITLANAALRMRDRLLFSGISWKIDRGDHWAVVGPNGAGKSTLVRALAGEVPVVRGKIVPAVPGQLRRQAAVVSFEKQRDMMAREERGEEARYFSGDWGGGIRVRDLLHFPRRTPVRGDDMLFGCHIERFRDRRIRDLSSGEMRWVQIALALAASPRLLILDEPFETLDVESRNELADRIQHLMDRKRSVVLVTHRRREILPKITHVMGVKDGHVVFQGRRESMPNTEAMDALYVQPVLLSDHLSDGALLRGFAGEARGEALIDLQNVRVAYGGVAVLDNLSWTVREGEHWVICGSNGSGKTTLLRLIVGEHPQAYANTVRVLGKRRGPGSSIRGLKEQIGLVSLELQVRYVKNVTAVEAVISGFFASIGLYRHPGLRQTATAERWMKFLGIQHLAGQPFKHLSQGEQRIVLLARALVKSPRLLVLDEPCQGLDRSKRRMILNILDRIAISGATTILYVTHHPEEIPACINRRLSLVRSGAGAFRAVSSMV